MAEYTYLCADLRTNAILAELPLSNVSFEVMMKAAGSFSAELPLGDSKVTALDPIGSSQPKRTALYVDRDGVLVWGGIIWTRRYDSMSKKLRLGGAEFWSYFARRRIRSTLTYAATDQFAIAQGILNYAQSRTGGNIGVIVGSEVSGVLRDHTYYHYETKPVAEAIEQLAGVENGFDFAIDVAWSGTTPTKTFRLSYPRRGRVAGSTGLFFDLPGNIEKYEWPEDGTSSSDTIYALGAGEGDSMLIATASRPELIDAGYPLLEDTVSFKDVTEAATLQAHAEATVNAKSNDVITPSVSVRANLDPVLGSYIAGDDSRYLFTDERFPDSLDTYLRILGYQVRVDDDGNEEVSLIQGEV